MRECFLVNVRNAKGRRVAGGSSIGRIGACLLLFVTLKGFIGCTGVPKAGDEERAADDRGATPRPVNMAPAMSLCLRRLLGLMFIVATVVVYVAFPGSRTSKFKFSDDQWCTDSLSSYKSAAGRHTQF